MKTIQMSQQSLNKMAKQIAIQVPGVVAGIVLLVLARSRDFEAWTDMELPGIVWIRCNESQVEEILELAILLVEMMKVRALENLAKSIFEVGDTPPVELVEAIEVAQGQFLGLMWAEIDASDSATDRGSCCVLSHGTCKEVLYE